MRRGCGSVGPVPARFGDVGSRWFGASVASMRPLILVALWASTPHPHHVCGAGHPVGESAPPAVVTLEAGDAGFASRCAT